MKLSDFIESFVCKNTLIRLWQPLKGGHKMIVKEDKKVCMEWELLQDKVWQSEYANCEVVGVTDIVVDDFYKEAISIVINIESNKTEDLKNSVGNAMSILKEALKEDKEPGSYYYSWQSNLACAIMDNSKINHDKANEIAIKFLELLIS